MPHGEPPETGAWVGLLNRSEVVVVDTWGWPKGLGPARLSRSSLADVAGAVEVLGEPAPSKSMPEK